MAAERGGHPLGGPERRQAARPSAFFAASSVFCISAGIDGLPIHDLRARKRYTGLAAEMAKICKQLLAITSTSRQVDHMITIIALMSKPYAPISEWLA
jgi:hypothetical protein